MLICGFCGDKDIHETLRILQPFVTHALAVKTTNPRSLGPGELAANLEAVGIPATPCATLPVALDRAAATGEYDVLICGSLFLAGEALAALNAYPWPADRLAAAELLHPVC